MPHFPGSEACGACRQSYRYHAGRRGSDILVGRYWDGDFANHLKRHGKYIRIHYGAGLKGDPDPRAHNAYVELQNAARQRVHSGEYCTVIFAWGFGTEISQVENSPFVGYGFWQSDPFEDPTYDGRITRGDNIVLISGTGDGAVQDFLRVITHSHLPVKCSTT